MQSWIVTLPHGPVWARYARRRETPKSTRIAKPQTLDQLIDVHVADVKEVGNRRHVVR